MVGNSLGLNGFNHLELPSSDGLRHARNAVAALIHAQVDPQTNLRDVCGSKRRSAFLAWHVVFVMMQP